MKLKRVPNSSQKNHSANAGEEQTEDRHEEEERGERRVQPRAKTRWGNSAR